MDFRTRLKGAGIVVLVCALALPASFFITFLTFPFWRWLESATGIESFGHHGPADWCFWLVYGLLLLFATYIWWRIRRHTE